MLSQYDKNARFQSEKWGVDPMYWKFTSNDVSLYYLQQTV